jgi:hypothetical protein
MSCTIAQQKSKHRSVVKEKLLTNDPRIPSLNWSLLLVVHNTRNSLRCFRTFPASNKSGECEVVSLFKLLLYLLQPVQHPKGVSERGSSSMHKLCSRIFNEINP